jgi:hypothetical protein
MKCFRQGDVLIMSVKDVPTDCEPIESENGVTTVMLGEATGHHHSFYEPVFFKEEIKTKRRFIVIPGGKTVALKHQEHAPIELPPGNYEVIRQREFEDEGWRRVND